MRGGQLLLRFPSHESMAACRLVGTTTTGHRSFGLVQQVVDCAKLTKVSVKSENNFWGPEMI